MPVFDPGVPWLRGTATLTNASTIVETDGVITLNEILEGDRLYVFDNGSRLGPFEIVGGEEAVIELREAFEGATGSYPIIIDRNPITRTGAKTLRDVADILARIGNFGELSERDQISSDLIPIGPERDAIKDALDVTKRASNLADLTNLKEARSNLGEFATVADVQSRHIPAVLKSIRTEGFHEPGVGALTLIRKTQGAPDLPGDQTSADGAKWEIAGTDITILQLGALADGDGAGGGTSIDTAFQNAIDLLAHRGGGTLRLPCVGTAVYRLDGLIHGAANVEIVCDPGVRLDVTHGGRLQWEGSVEAEIDLGANATRGDTTLVTAEPHGLQRGDWVLLKSQRVAMNYEDAGEEWWLGVPTGSSYGPYFAEPCRVDEILSPTEVRIAEPLLFPDYRTDDSQETSPAARPCSTIQKINWMVEPKFRGGQFINTPHQLCMGFKWCYRPRVDETQFTFNVGTQRGHAVRMESCWQPYVFRTRADRPGLEETYDVNHHQFNSYYDVGTWHSTWDLISDSNGAQGLDVSWLEGQHPTINFMVKDLLVVGNIECGITTHSGAYGGTILNPRIYGAGRSSIFTRSRNIHIVNPVLLNGGHGGNTSKAGINVVASGVNTVVTGGFISGFYYGIRYRDADLSQRGPRRIGLFIDGTVFEHNRRNVQLDTVNPNRETAELTGIVIQNARHLHTEDRGVSIGQYLNGVTVRNNFFGPILEPGGYGIVTSANAVQHTFVGNVGQDIGSGRYLLHLSTGVSDTSTFDPDLYPNARHTLHDNRVVGSGELLSPLSDIRLGGTRVIGSKGEVGLTDTVNLQEGAYLYENRGNTDWAFLTSDLGTIRLLFGRRGDSDRGGIYYQQLNDYMRFRTAGSNRWDISHQGHLLPASDNAYNLGASSVRIGEIHAANGTIQTSDERLKTPLRELEPDEIKVAIRLSKLPGIYQWLSAVAEKGEGSARLHIGVSAQQVREAFEAEGLDAFRYGVLCFDQWDARGPVIDDEGAVVEPARAAGDRYSIRYDQLAQWQAVGWDARLQTLEGQANG